MVGAGRVGTALAALLQRAGHRIVGVSGRDATRERAERYLPGVLFAGSAAIVHDAELVIVATPDDTVATACGEIAGTLRAGQLVAHVSGALGLDALAAAKGAGAVVLSMHPLQTFPDVDAALERVPGSGVAVTADDERGFETGEALARDLGATPFRVADELKPLYHAAAVFGSNFVVAVLAIAEDVMRRAGVDDPLPLLLPLTRATVDAVAQLGPGAALTGPAVRGDAGTVESNLRALGAHAPDAVDAYIELTAAALALASTAGRLDGPARQRIEEVLASWR